MCKKFILNNKALIVIFILVIFVLFYFLSMGLNKKCHVINLSNQKHSVEAQTVNLSKTFITAIRAHQYKKIASLFEVFDTNPNDLVSWADNTSDFFPNTKEKSIKLIEIKQAGKNKKSKVATIRTSLVYQFDNRFTIASLVSNHANGKVGRILWFQVGSGFGTFEKTNNFNSSSLKDLTIKRFFALVLWFAMPLLTLIALITCIKTTFTKSKFKWLWKSSWIIFICMGFMLFSFDWATQIYEARVLAFVLFSVGLHKASCFLPLYLTSSIPLGAIIYLLKHFFCGKQTFNNTKKN
jgi:hypothetical protein